MARFCKVYRAEEVNQWMSFPDKLGCFHISVARVPITQSSQINAADTTKVSFQKACFCISMNHVW